MKLFKKIAGFTLTELVVTTAIMGTLAAVSVPSFIETNAKAKANKTMSNLSDIGSAVGQRFNDLSGKYGHVIIFPGTAAGATGTVMQDIKVLGYWNGITEPVTWVTTVGETQNAITFKQLLGQVTKSPFSDIDYNWTNTYPGSVSYNQEEEGNIVVVVSKAQMTLTDSEDPTNMKMSFAY